MAVVPLNLAVLYNVLLGQTHRSAFVASQDDPEGHGPPIELPDGSEGDSGHGHLHFRRPRLRHVSGRQSREHGPGGIVAL